MTDVTAHPSGTRPSAARPSATRPGTGSPGRRRSWLAGALLTPLLAGCATSFGAQTSQVYQPGPGITVRGSDVYVLNALIVTDGRGNGTLVGGLINEAAQTDTLESVQVTDPAGNPVSATIQPGTIALPDQRPVQLADNGAVRLGGNLQAGVNDSLILTFRNAAPITMTIPVVAQSAQFSSVPVGPTPTPMTPSP